jgi:hypothetical protein
MCDPPGWVKSAGSAIGPPQIPQPEFASGEQIRYKGAATEDTMPAIGGLILLAQIACAVHVMRTGRNTYWIYLVIFVPMIGMAAYFIVEILPGMMNSRSAQRAASEVVRTLDPGRGLREAQRRVQITPTAENKTALAEEHLRAGAVDAAIALYREVLVGVHATDPAIMLGLARALFAKGELAETQSVLERLRAANPGYNSSEGHLLYARSLELQGKQAAALDEYAALATYYPGQEARCRYALLLRQSGRFQEARRLFEEICQAIDYGPRHQYREQREWYQLAKRELAS